MGHDEQNLVDPVGYTPAVDKFSTWLRSGVSAFRK